MHFITTYRFKYLDSRKINCLFLFFNPLMPNTSPVFVIPYARYFFELIFYYLMLFTIIHEILQIPITYYMGTIYNTWNYYSGFRRFVSYKKPIV